MIKRHHIRQFLAVADAGSFVQAAARLHITQPSLSAGIAELERLVAARLFVRNRRHVRLTEAGGAFLAIARDLERGFRTAESFGQAPARDWPTLRLGTIRTIAPAHLRAVVEPLLEAFGVELVEGSDAVLRAQLQAGRIGAALTTLREGEAGALWHEAYVMLVAEQHRLIGKVLPEDLASEIMIARRSCEVLEETSRFFTAAGVRPRFALRSDSDERCLAMVAAGLGITTAPRSLAIPGTRALAVAGYDLDRRIGLLCDPAVAAEIARHDLGAAIGAQLAAIA